MQPKRSSRFALGTALLLTVAFAAPAAAQRTRPGRAVPVVSQPAGQPAPPGALLAFNDQLLPVEGVDLVVGIREANADKRVVYSIRNRGTQPTPSGFHADVFVDGVRKDTIPIPAMAGGERRELVAANVQLEKCGEHTVRVVADKDHVVSEVDEANNEHSEAVVPPCPDLAVKSIKRDETGLFGETYQVKVTVINLGNAPSRKVEAFMATMTSAPGINGWPTFSPAVMIPVLQPGEKISFSPGGNALSSATSHVRVILDRYFLLDESNEENNFVMHETI